MASDAAPITAPPIADSGLVSARLQAFVDSVAGPSSPVTVRAELEGLAEDLGKAVHCYGEGQTVSILKQTRGWAVAVAVVVRAPSQLP